jgi:hypothetical protein
VKSLEQQLLEKEQELQKLRKTAVAAALTQELRESGLPDFAQAHVLKRFQATGRTEGVKEAIAEEAEYLRKLGANKRAAAPSGGKPATVDLVESYKLLGLSQKEAAIAAGVEHAVADIQESRQKLADAARLLGLSDREADLFSRM